MFIKNLIAPALAAAVLALPQAASAVPVLSFFNFGIETVNGDATDLLGGTAFGFLTYDTDDLDASGDGTLFGPELDFTVSFNGDVFSQADDVDFPAFPSLTFEAFVPTSINLIFDTVGANPYDFSDDRILSISVVSDIEFTDGSPGLDTIYATATLNSTMAPVPLPASLPLLAGGLGLIAVARRRRKS